MVVAGLRLVNFRSCCDACRGPGLNVVVETTRPARRLGGGVVRTRQLAADAQGRSSSPGATLCRWNSSSRRPTEGCSVVGFAPAKASGCAGTAWRWRPWRITHSRVFIFVPESLLLVKEARRVAAPISTPSAPLDIAVRGRRRDLQLVVRQRNTQLAAERRRSAPWTIRMHSSRVATELGRLPRSSRCRGFSETAAALAPAGGRPRSSSPSWTSAIRRALLLGLRVRRPAGQA